MQFQWEATQINFRVLVMGLPSYRKSSTIIG